VLIAFNFPFAEARNFLPASTTHIVPFPDWKEAQPGKDFVREFGGMQYRHKKGIKEWPSEEFFCAAYGAVRLPTNLSALLGGYGWKGGRCAFRRLFSNGNGVTRMEIGLALDEHSFLQVPGEELVRLVCRAFSIDVRVRAGPNGFENCKLVHSMKALAKHYLTSTTRRNAGKGFRPPKWWVTPGEPLVFIELPDAKVAPVPKGFHRISLGDSATLFHARCSLDNQDFSLWILNSGLKNDPDYIRRVRLHLFRLHAERQCLKCIMLRITGNKIPVPVCEETSDPLQRFLNNASGLLVGKSVYGLPISQTLESIQSFEDLVSEGERTTLLNTLREIRPNILRNIRECTETSSELAGKVTYNVAAGGTLILSQAVKKGKKIVKVFNTTVGTNTGNLLVAESIKNSSIMIKGSTANNELKTNLTKLADAVAKMCEKLPKEQAEDAGKRLEALTREATSGAPSEKWYQFSANGLIEAAKAVGEFATPVITTVAAISKLLGMG